MLVSEDHIRAALGHKRCDLLIKGRLVNTGTGEIEEISIAIYDKKVVGIGDYDARKVVRCEYICPGLIDAHVHIESGMLSPLEFSKAVAAHGTTAVIADPHEIANVSGIEGVIGFLKESRDAIIKIFFMAPSCVPASRFEMSFGRLNVSNIKRLYKLPEVIGLGEVMDYAGVLECKGDVMKKVGASRLVDGHAPGLSGYELNAYLTAGIDSDHETSKYAEALEKLRKGMWLMMREGSCSKDLNNIIGVALEVPDTRRIVFATDDRDVVTIHKKGHIDDMIRMAIKEGIDPVKAIQMATINPSGRYGLPMGIIMPGRDADIILLDDLEKFRIKDVMLSGTSFKSIMKIKNGRAVTSPSFRPCTVFIPALCIDDISIKSDIDRNVRVIGAHGDSLYTDELQILLKSINGILEPDYEKDIAKVISVRRYPGDKMVATGFINGFGLKSGAMAQTICHDSHNAIAIGTNDRDILAAITRLGAIGGGIVTAEGGKIMADLPLPYAGLMSDKPLDNVAEALECIVKNMKRLGCSLEDPVMTLSFMGLSVLPELKLTCRGLVNVKSQKIVSVFTS